MERTLFGAARQPARPIDVRTDVHQAEPGPPPRGPKGKLDYPFEAIPRAVFDRIHEHRALPVPPRADDPERERARRRMLDDRMRPVDADVLHELHGWWRKRGIRNTCWTTKEVIAAATGLSVKTVQGSFRRLSLHGFIEQVPVAMPDDPDDPRNHTGWRIALLYLPAHGQQRGAGPDRRPPAERRRRPVASPPPPGCLPPLTGVGAPVASPPSPSPQAPGCLHPSHPVASNQRAGASKEGTKGSEGITFNVAAPPDPKNSEPPAGPAPPSEPPPPLPAPPAARGERPAAEVLAAVLLGAVFAAAPREKQADRIRALLGRRGWRLGLRPDGMVTYRHPASEQADLPAADKEQLSDEERAVLRWLKPEVVAALARERAGAAAPPAGATGPDPAAGTPAPRVRDAAGFRRLIGGLRADADCARFAAALLSDPGFGDDRDPELTRRTLTGLARAVLNRELAEEVLVGALGEACGPKVCNRGAALVAAVKRRKAGEAEAKRRSGC